jgi:hypothetical protein
VAAMAGLIEEIKRVKIVKPKKMRWWGNKKY